MLNFAEQTGSGAVIVVWSLLIARRFRTITYPTLLLHYTTHTSSYHLQATKHFSCLHSIIPFLSISLTHARVNIFNLHLPSYLTIHWYAQIYCLVISSTYSHLTTLVLLHYLPVLSSADFSSLLHFTCSSVFCYHPSRKSFLTKG